MQGRKARWCSVRYDKNYKTYRDLVKVGNLMSLAVLADVYEWEEEELQEFENYYVQLIDSIYNGFDRPEKMLEYLKENYNIEIDDSPFK